MKIEWTIKKKRGNFRPTLDVKFKLEDYETNMNILPVGIKTPFPREAKAEGKNYFFTSSWKKRCPHDTDLKSWKKFHTICLDTTQSESSCTYYLPWKPGASSQYPEVAIVLKALQRKYEKALKEAYDSLPFEINESLDMSSDCKKYIAPGIVAKKMLKVVNG